MKISQVACFLSVIITIVFRSKLNATTQNSNDFQLQISNPLTSENHYYTGIISDGGSGNKSILIQDKDGLVYLANTGNTFSNGIIIQGTIANTAIVGVGYPPGGYTTAVGNSGNSYMGSGRTIRFMQHNTSASVGGILELGCDMSIANTALQANTTGSATIRGYNQTSAYTISFATYTAGIPAGGAISVGAGATVIFGFPLPVGASTTYYSAFNISGTSTNSGTLKLANNTLSSSSPTPVNVNAYGVLDCSLCTSTLANATGTGAGSILTVHANGTLRFPNTNANWTKNIVLSP